MSWLIVFVACAVGAVLPGLGSELWLAGAATMVGPAAAAGLVVVATVAHVAGKLVVYGCAAGGAASITARRPPARWQRRMERSKGAATTVLFTSALASVPPLWVTTVASGACRLGPVRFGATVFAGRLLRYSAIVAAPQLLLEVLR